MKRLLIFLIQISLVNNCFSQSIAIKKGTPSPFDGVLIDNAKANQLKNNELEVEGLTKINLYLNQLNDLKQKNTDLDAQKLQVLADQNTQLAQDLQAAKQASSLEKLGYIALGVVATALGGFAISRVK